MRTAFIILSIVYFSGFIGVGVAMDEQNKCERCAPSIIAAGTWPLWMPGFLAYRAVRP